ncbi:MAG: hypothetical protein JST80_09400 [Bdellovibrionales bacterium]|nr:hypothetical protein [Bdellovibrionales bacterium]
MNKLVLLVSMFVGSISFASKSATAPDLRVTFEYETNLKFRQARTLEIDKRKVYVNGVALDPVRVMVLHRYLRNAVITPVDATDGICAAGKYIYKKTRNRKTETFEGCVGSKSFVTLNDTFKKLF